MQLNKMVVHFNDGRILKGHSNAFRPKKPDFHFEPLEGETSPVNIPDLKAIFFVRDYDGDPNRQDAYEDQIAGAGRKMRVKFADGEEITGFAASYSPDRQGFFLIPADRDSNNERIFVVASSCEDVAFV